jgi:hypothetical protein
MMFFFDLKRLSRTYITTDKKSLINGVAVVYVAFSEIGYSIVVNGATRFTLQI